jgi:hypothetical protein
MSAAVAALALALVHALPTPRTAEEVEQQLAAEGDARLEALEALPKACRGSLRLVLRDHAAIVRRVSALATEGPAPQRRAALGALRCFRPAVIEAPLRASFGDADRALAAFALEVASNTRDAALVGAVLDHAEGVVERCASSPPSGDALEACVWAVYAASTMLDGADAATRTRARTIVAPATESEAPKLREVAVETLAATRQRAAAAVVAKLVEREKKKGGFTAPNTALVSRFVERQRALEKAKE